jgi:hypothetical protein
MCDCKPKWIRLAGNSRTPIADGGTRLIHRIEIRSQGYIPDVYVRFNTPVIELQLYDDPAVLGHVMSVLGGLGYPGPLFERAELGMQGRDFIVLEPGPAFRRFVVERYHWYDLARRARACHPTGGRTQSAGRAR